MKYFFTVVCIFGTLFLLSGCFHKKTNPVEIPITGNLTPPPATGMIYPKTSSGINQISGSTNTIVTTGNNKDVIQNTLDDKNFDPKNFEDKEIDELLEYIEKVVNE